MTKSQPELKNYITKQDGWVDGKHRKKGAPLSPMTELQAEHDLIGGKIELAPKTTSTPAAKKASKAKS